MTYDYDAESDSLYLRFRDGEYAESEEIYPGFVIDFDKEGKPLALDIDEASKFVDVPALRAATAALPGVVREPAAAKKR